MSGNLLADVLPFFYVPGSEGQFHHRDNFSRSRYHYDQRCEHAQDLAALLALRKPHGAHEVIPYMAAQHAMGMYMRTALQELARRAFHDIRSGLIFQSLHPRHYHNRGMLDVGVWPYAILGETEATLHATVESTLRIAPARGDVGLERRARRAQLEGW